MRIVFAGTPEIALPSLHALMASREHSVVGVVTRPDAPAGRGRKLTPSPVAARAEQLGLEVLKPEHPRDPAFQQQLRMLRPDVCAVVAYGSLLPQSALDIPRHGWINLHFSLLPRWRGAAPVQRSIMAGDAETGTTCFRIVRALDAGPIHDVDRLPMPLVPAGELLDRLALSGAERLVRVMDMIEAGAEPVEQPTEGVTHAPKLTSEEARIDFSDDAVTVRNHIHGCSPAPGAWCEYRGERFKIFSAQLIDFDGDLAPGELHVTKKHVHLGTGDGVLLLGDVQAPGKRRMPAIDWARGGVDGTLQ